MYATYLIIESTFYLKTLVIYFFGLTILFFNVALALKKSFDQQNKIYTIIWCWELEIWCWKFEFLVHDFIWTFR